MEYDEVGRWSEVKLEIVEAYAQEYARILTKQGYLKFHYIDAFAGKGKHRSRETGDIIPGSPLRAIDIKPAFQHYHFIDLDNSRIENLRQLVGDQPNVHFYTGDANDVLLQQIIHQISWDGYNRALCLLDPYGLHLKWEVLQAAGESQTMDVILNFSIMDMNMNVLRRDPETTNPTQAERGTAFWGDDSWRKCAYTSDRNLFGYEEKADNDCIVEALRERLEKKAGFQHVPRPIAMKNASNAVVYYLFFASQKSVAGQIANHIFRKYERTAP